MIRVITIDEHYELNDVYDIEITSDCLHIHYQHPNDDAYIYTFKLCEVLHMFISEPATIKFSVRRSTK